jgi:hypothetical protein
MTLTLGSYRDGPDFCSYESRYTKLHLALLKVSYNPSGQLKTYFSENPTLVHLVEKSIAILTDQARIGTCDQFL